MKTLSFNNNAGITVNYLTDLIDGNNQFTVLQITCNINGVEHVGLTPELIAQRADYFQIGRCYMLREFIDAAVAYGYNLIEASEEATAPVYLVDNRGPVFEVLSLLLQDDPVGPGDTLACTVNVKNTGLAGSGTINWDITDVAGHTLASGTQSTGSVAKDETKAVALNITVPAGETDLYYVDVAIGDSSAYNSIISWSCYWTTQDEVLFFGEVSKIRDSKLYNQKRGATDYLIVGAELGANTYKAPNTQSYKDADTDYFWFNTDGSQRLVSTAELVSYDIQRIPVKYDDESPYAVSVIIILNASVTGAKRDNLFKFMELPVLWDNNYSAYGHVKNNRIESQVLWVPYDAETIAYNLGAVNPLTNKQINIVDTLVKSLKSQLSLTNLSDAFDWLYLLFEEDLATAIRNITKDAHHGSVVGNLVHTALEGITGDGLTAALNTNFNPSTQGVRFTGTNAEVFVYSRKEVTEDKTDIGCASAGGAGTTQLKCRSTETNISGRMNGGSLRARVGTTGSLGLHSVSKNGAALCHLRVNGVQISTDITDSASMLANAFMHILALCVGTTLSDFSTRQIAVAGAGKYLTPAEDVILKNIIETALDANGKGVL